MNILFITHNRLGDAVLSTCILNNLHEHYPQAQFTVVTGPIPAELFDAIPNLKRLIVIKKAKYHLHWLKLWSKVFFTRWSIVVDCRGSALSWLVWTQQRFYKYPTGSQSLHRVQRYTGMLKSSHITLPKIWIDSTHHQKALQILPQVGRFIAIGPAANWRAKTWRSSHFIELIRELRKADGLYPDAYVLLIAAPHERQQIQKIIESIPANRFIDLIGTQSLLTIAACMQRCAVFIGNDSGLMHMAAAVGTPTIGLFGPTDKQKYAPYGPHCHVVSTPESPEKLMNYPGFHWETCDSLMDSIRVEDIVRILQNTQ